MTPIGGKMIKARKAGHIRGRWIVDSSISYTRVQRTLGQSERIYGQYKMKETMSDGLWSE